MRPSSPNDDDRVLGLKPPVVTTEDGFRRRVSYLRISLTDRCNLRCRYCMPKEGIAYFPKESLLSTEEIKRLIEVFQSLGVNKIRLTGGEPLLRSDIADILAHIYSVGISDVSITTNGILLKEKLGGLLEAGLTRINISLDTFRHEKFERITGADAYEKVITGLFAAMESGLSPVKINMVVMRGWNTDEIPDFVEFARIYPIEVRFLELMPTRNNFEGTAMVSNDSFVSVKEIRAEVERHASLGAEDPIQGVARSYPVLGGQGKIGFVSPVSNHFCATCNRVRLTSTGGLKTCLHGEEVVDLKAFIRKGANEEEIAQAIRAALFRKPEEHFIRSDNFESRHLQMSQVGG